MKTLSIVKTPPNVAEAIIRADFILKLKRMRDELIESRQDDYLFSDKMSVTDTYKIEEHLRDAQKSLEVCICSCK